jgi:cold shock CspA family protein
LSGFLGRGTVAAFDDEVGLGTVQGEDGRTWQFHCTRISDGTRTIAPGAPVVFEVGPGGPGRWEATAVVKVAPRP